MTHDEMNRLAAETVMGWRLDDGYWVVGRSCTDEYALTDYNIHDWNPCTSIADAWLLVEKMIENGFITSVYSYKGTHEVEIYLSDKSPDAVIDLNGVSFVKANNTAPLAITMACLQAKEVR